MPLPPEYNNLCAFPTAESLADSLEEYHDDVHTAVGGAMRAFYTAPGAVIFWLWHGFIDDLYHAYEARCENRKDFNRDVHTDVLWHNVDTGELGVWFLDGTTVANPGSLSWQAAESSGWQAKGTGDFNGDGRTDVLWHNPGTGSVAVWLLNGTTVIDDAVMNWTVLGSTGWELKGTGDFNRDGKIDLVWHNPGTGLVNVWLMNGTTVVSDPMLNWTVLGSTGWELKGTGDFNRDGHIDLLWHNPGTGTVATWLMNGTTVTSGPSLSWTVLASSGWELKGTGDFNRDGHVDVLWHQASTSTASVWLMNGTTVSSPATLSWTAGHPWKIVSR